MRLCTLLVLVPALAAAAPLPPFFTIPPQMKGDDDAIHEEEWGEAEFPIADAGEPPVRRGHHWWGYLPFQGLPNDMEDNDVWAKVKPGLVKGGWQVVKELDVNPFMATVRLQKGGRDAWGYMMFASPSDIRIELVEVGPQPVKFAVPPPAATPEKIAKDHGDFPYLPPLPGSKVGDASWDPEEPLYVPTPGQDEQQLVATGMMKRWYNRKGTSAVQFQTLYREAMKAAGWTIVVDSQGIHQGDAQLIGHYAKNGRDVWALLHGPDDYVVSVADVGTEDLAKKLATDCHVSLYGVFFDFDKATLKPESDAVLARAAAALKANPKLGIEVQGHTDNKGADDYNLKLSDARAKSVLQWLVKNGVPAAQLTSKGYGRTKPVASNDDDLGRAKNRRVELACRK